MISIIIPAYNAGAAIERALESIFQQSYRDYDGSIDDTRNILKKYDSRISYVRQENAGASAARNTGIGLAKGHWIAFLDADDEWMPNKLEEQMALLKRNPFLKWCATNFLVTDGLRRAPKIDKKRLMAALNGREYVDDYFLQASLGRCHIGTPTVILHRDIIDEVENFDNSLWYAEDTDMWWRILHRFPLVGFIPDPLAVVHLDLEESTLSKRRLEAKRGDLIRRIVAENLESSKTQGDRDQFLALARTLMKKTILTMLFHGHGQDAKDALSQFEGILDWRFTKLLNLLSEYPKFTQKALRTAAVFISSLGLEADVSRRWLHLK
jgi:glycosyltransferase involved in cell wall biosynthesis